jgi:2-polyprenyl-3-methyl-5-hydroxy-6-metoxy-1,4-benzoquinol methylase
MSAATWNGTADAHEVSFGRLCAGTVDPVMRKLGPSLHGERLLDVGCGPGGLAATATRAGFDVVGVDADHSMLDLAHRRHPSLAFIQALYLICRSPRGPSIG